MLRPAKPLKSLGLIALAALLSAVALPPAMASNDPLFPEQWSIAKMQAEPAWATSRGDGIKVAVIDTGVDFSHEDLAGKGAGSFNCIKDADSEEPCDPAPDGDDNGHGTQVSGIIAASEGNGKGIAPVAPGAMIMSFKALDASGSGGLSDVLRAIRSAADNDAAVINLSLGPEVNLINDLLNLVLGSDPKQAFAEAFRYAADKGALVVAAAGNSGTSSFFAGLENVYVVGSTGPDDEAAFYSASGAEIFAPGGNSRGLCNPARCINTTSTGGYKAVQGTSFAAPHVAGVAALTMSKGLNPRQARARINETADLIREGRRVNALGAVSGSAPPPAPPPQKAAPVTPPRPPQRPPTPPAIVVPVPAPPPVTDLVPILVLSSSEVHKAPARQPLIAQRTEAASSPWAWTLAAILAGIIALAHGLFRFSAYRAVQSVHK